MALTRPALILAGYGMGDSLHLTVESQRALARASRVFSIGLPPHLAALLRAQRVVCFDLASRFAPGRPIAEIYLDVADTVLREARENPPVVVLSEGNPMLSNAISRFLVTKGKQLGLVIQVLPAVSPIDSAICQVGLDVGSFGLQVFDARRLVTRELPLQPAVPLLLLQLASVGLTEGVQSVESNPGAYQSLADYLGRHYPPAHPVVHLLNAERAGGTSVLAAPLSAFDSLVPGFGPASTLFVDRVRRTSAAE